MNRMHSYRHLDDDVDHFRGSRLTVRLTTREVAEQIVDMDYGAHRLLSHLVDVMRERVEARAKVYDQRGDTDVAAYVRREGSPLADGIEALLNRGEWK